MSWRWIDRRALELLHNESLAEHGGVGGVRDEGLLESASARPLTAVAHGEPDVAELAAFCGVGLAKDRAFVDGNHRAAFLAVGLFLALNGHRLRVSQVEATLTMMAVAAGEMREEEFAQWIRKHCVPR